MQATQVPWLTPGPLPWSEHWTAYVNAAETEQELAALRRSVLRGAPLGDEDWQGQTAEELAWNPLCRAQDDRRNRRGFPSKPNLTALLFPGRRQSSFLSPSALFPRPSILILNLPIALR